MTTPIGVFVPPLSHYIGWKAFEPEECDRIKKIGELMEFHKGKVNKAGGPVDDPSVRQTDVTWIEPGEKTMWIFDRMDQVVSYLNFMHFQMDLVQFDGFQYSKYKVGGHYKRHADTHSRDGLYRKLSMSIMLSDPEEYEGGELVLDLGGPDPLKFKPKKGEMIIFYSHILHSVEPVTSGNRVALVTWAMGEKIK